MKVGWLSKLPLFNKVYRQGGIDSFHLAHKDIWATMKDDVEKMADDRLHDKLVELLTIVDDRFVITFSDRMKAIFIGGERADEVRLKALKAEAEFLLNSEVWKILYESPKELAQRAMFVAGESVSDMTKGRAILYTLSTQKKILETLKGYEPAKSSAPPGKGV